ncbi:hypothetical protein ACWCPQ_16790 [Nocardia sp. NPDC001965]|uniref:hypothetical protein n=1 Tax=Nocardia TaxID=1817 RepID=UPI00245447C2|nr:MULTISPECIES: hypothetical protein [Nocardia]
MSRAQDMADAYRAGLAAAADPRAVNPYTPAAPGSDRVLLARLWWRGRLKHARPVPDDE